MPGETTMLPSSSRREANREIRNLLFVLTSSVLFAGLLAAYMITFWGPSGTYQVQKILLSPDLIPTLSYRESGTHLVFHRVELLYPHQETGEWTVTEVSLPYYREFYQSLSQEESLLTVDPSIEQRFMSSQLRRLVLTLRPDQNLGRQFQYRTFQEVHFSPDGDYYRIELKDAGDGAQWAYFFHPGIWAFTREVLTRRS